MTDLTDAYENGAHIPGGEEYPPRWVKAAQAFRECHDVRELDQYHTGTRRAVQLVTPEATPKGTFVFVHGGYWQQTDPSYWTHLAAGAVECGWRVALIAYDLCPAVRISTITEQVADAMRAVAQAFDGPISIAGHSAGGHLVARMLAPGLLEPSIMTRLKRAVPISVLSDLRPLMQTKMNAVLHLDDIEAKAESPIFQSRPSAEVMLWVGGDERPVFLDQTRWLAEAWDVPQHVEPGKHHFDVIDALEIPDSPLVRFLTLQDYSASSSS